MAGEHGLHKRLDRHTRGHLAKILRQLFSFHMSGGPFRRQQSQLDHPLGLCVIFRQLCQLIFFIEIHTAVSHGTDQRALPFHAQEGKCTADSFSQKLFDSFIDLLVCGVYVFANSFRHIRRWIIHQPLMIFCEIFRQDQRSFFLI